MSAPFVGGDDGVTYMMAEYTEGDIRAREPLSGILAASRPVSMTADHAIRHSDWGSTVTSIRWRCSYV